MFNLKLAKYVVAAMLAVPAVPLMARTTVKPLSTHHAKHVIHRHKLKTTKKTSHGLSSKSKLRTASKTAGRPTVKFTKMPPTIDNIHT